MTVAPRPIPIVEPKGMAAAALPEERPITDAFPSKPQGPTVPERDSIHMKAPAEGLYWAVLTGLPRRPTDEGLLYALEPWLPCGLDEVEARFVRASWAPRGAVLGCAVEKRLLEEWLAEAEKEGPVEAVRPAVLPEAVRARLGEAPSEAHLRALVDALDFRGGDYASPRARRRRRARLTALAAGLAACAALLTAGLWRDADRARREAAAAETATAALVRQALSEAAGNAGGIDPSLRLAAELRRLELAGDPSAAHHFGQDRVATLLAVLAAWPRDIPTRVDHLSVEQDVVTARGEVRDAADFEALRLALGALAPEWVEKSASSGRAREGFSFSIALGRPQPSKEGKR